MKLDIDKILQQVIELQTDISIGLDNETSSVVDRLIKIQNDLDQLKLYSVTPRLLFDEGIKYYKELADESAQELNIDTATIIAKDYAKHVAHFLKLNES